MENSKRKKDWIKNNCLPITNMDMLNDQLTEFILWYDKKYCKSIDGANEVVGEYLMQQNDKEDLF